MGVHRFLRFRPHPSRPHLPVLNWVKLLVLLLKLLPDILAFVRRIHTVRQEQGPQGVVRAQAHLKDTRWMDRVPGVDDLSGDEKPHF